MKNMLEIQIDDLDDLCIVAKKMGTDLLFSHKGALAYNEIWFPVESNGLLTIFTCIAAQRDVESFLEVGQFTVIDAEWKVGS